MPRAFDLRAASHATGVELKWLDNLLTLHPLPGVERRKQGVQRRISDDGLLAIELVRLLTAELGVSVRVAAALAARAVAGRAEDEVRLTMPSGLALLFPAGAIEARLRARLVDAVESVGRVRRGRPPGSGRRRPE